MKALLNEEFGVLECSSELDESACNRIIGLGSGRWESSEVDDGTGADVLDSGLRVSEVFWTREDWLKKLVWSYMEAFNDVSGLRYDIDEVETLQVAKYGEGGHYDFHVDSFSSHKWAIGGKVRKISMTIQLNEDYEGGEFEIVRCREGKLDLTTLSRGRGSIILFPSCLEHRVKPVTRGVRYSLVAWFKGPPLR